MAVNTTTGKLDVFDFGRQLLDLNDLDPVYVLLYNAHLEPQYLSNWLIAYWCFYHVGTASWIAERPWEYWKRFKTAAESKDYPRCHERRHFRGANAIKSYEFLYLRGVGRLFEGFPRSPATAVQVTEYVQTWVGFGPWIAFKVADMMERLELIYITFDLDTAMYEGSPTEGAKLLNDLWGEGLHDPPHEAGVTSWAVEEVLKQLGKRKAPPNYNRPIGLQEVETILCKWKSYVGGHYKIGEDVKGCREGLLRFAGCRLSQRLLKAGRTGGLWRA